MVGGTLYWHRGYGSFVSSLVCLVGRFFLGVGGGLLVCLHFFV